MRYRFYELVTVLLLASLEQAQALPPGRAARELILTELDGRLDALEAY